MSQELNTSLLGHKVLAHFILPSVHIFTEYLSMSKLLDILNSVFALMVFKTLFTKEKLLTFGKTRYGEKGWTKQRRTRGTWTQTPAVLLPSALMILNKLLLAQMVKSLLQCRRPGFDPWVGNIPWRRKWQPISVFFPGQFYEQRSLGRLQSMESQKAGHD